jgi:hypothetical protein
MAVITFNALKLARKLEAAGFQPKQAGDTAEALSESLSEVAGLATTADVKESELRLDAKIEGVKSDILKWVLGAIAVQTALLSAMKFFGH